MKYIEKHPMTMIVLGILGISMSSILVKYSAAPSAVTAAFRLLWTVLLLTPLALGKREFRRELKNIYPPPLSLPPSSASRWWQPFSPPSSSGNSLPRCSFWAAP